MSRRGEKRRMFCMSTKGGKGEVGGCTCSRAGCPATSIFLEKAAGKRRRKVGRGYGGREEGREGVWSEGGRERGWKGLIR